MTSPENRFDIPLNIAEVLGHFRTSGSPVRARRFGSGHIHTTWLIESADKAEPAGSGEFSGMGGPDYILQQFNNSVFPLTAATMENILLVTGHLRRKWDAGSGCVVPELIETTTGGLFHTDALGNPWRMYRRIVPGISYDVVPDVPVAREAGSIFGKFIADLSDFAPEKLTVVIPGFHSAELRYHQLQEAIRNDASGRRNEVEAEIRFAELNSDAMMELPRRQASGEIPVRVTHNDTKLNNVLFDEQNRAVSVIDLDTVMPGLSLYDFGDLVRTAAGTGNEDEADLSRIGFSRSLYDAIREGFLEQAGHLLTPAEIALLPLSARYMTWIMGIRFLADYLNGDVYYKTHYQGQNLRRCRAQFRLMETMDI
ncbi:MAG: phosphotransferase enzyme family protein [Cyclonatronaceae bacterium]